MEVLYTIEKEKFEQQIHKDYFICHKIMYCQTWNQWHQNPTQAIAISLHKLKYTKENDTYRIEEPIPLSQIRWIDFNDLPGCTHILMSDSQIQCPHVKKILQKYIHCQDQVCILPLSFYEDIKTKEQWNAEYKEGVGLQYKEHMDMFTPYGIKKEQIQWVRYFEDTQEEMKQKILASNILVLTGGAPDLYMKRIKECRLKKIIREYQGTIIGYSAGAMIQLQDYHISPDEEYNQFSYQTGLGMIKEFDIEVHYQNTNIQNESIQKVIEEKKKTVYAIEESGGILYQNKAIQTIGHVIKYQKLQGNGQFR